MARFSAVGNENGNEERSNHRSLPKKPRISSTVTDAHRNPNSQTPTDNPIAAEKEPKSEESLTLMNPSALNCPVCIQPLSSPVNQCENGHIACLPCCTKMAKKCPSCSLPVHIRCRAIEMVLESVQTQCRNMMYGCMEKIQYSKRSGHESTCIYAPCSCPEIGCDYAGMSKCLYTHFASQHPQYSRKFCFDRLNFIALFADDYHTFLKEENDSILFILNRSIESIGNLFNVVCVAPATTKREYLYKLEVSSENSSVKLETHVECVPKWRPGDPAKVCLLVPHDFKFPNGMLLLVLTIRKTIVR